MMRIFLSVLLLTMVSGAGTFVYAVDIPELLAVPDTLAKPAKSQLLDQHKVLSGRIANLEKKIINFNSECHSVDKGSVAADKCRRSQGRLQSKLQSYIVDAKAFNLRIGFEEGRALLMGYAFKMGAKMRAFAHQSLKSINSTSRVLISIWYAERGDYQRARHFIALPGNMADDLQEMDSLLRSLERKKRKLLKTAIPRLVISGGFDSRLFSRYPDKFSLTLLRAHMNLQSGNYDAALGQIAAARNMNIESPALAGAAVYARQMKAAAMERQRPADSALIRHQENMAGAYAGWTLGMLLTDADMDATAVQTLTTSAQTLAREGNIDDAKTVFELAKSLSDGSGKNKAWLPSSGVYDGASEANILLDALEYGRHDWNKSLSFLRLAHKASPDNQRINEALAHAQALMASQR